MKTHPFNGFLTLLCYQGEIDIVEGVNDQSPNAATLHTTEGSAVIFIHTSGC